jgi:hypothetical protein
MLTRFIFRAALALAFPLLMSAQTPSNNLLMRWFITNGGTLPAWVFNNGPFVREIRETFCTGNLSLSKFSSQDDSGSGVVSSFSTSDVPDMSHPCAALLHSGTTINSWAGIVDNGSQYANYGPGLQTLPPDGTYYQWWQIRLNSITNVSAAVGLGSGVSGPAVPTEGAQFLIDTSSTPNPGNFKFRLCHSGVCGTPSDTGLAAVAGTIYNVIWGSFVSGTANWYIQPSGSSFATVSSSVSANFPTGTMRAGAYSKTLDTSDKILTVFGYQWLQTNVAP